MKTSKVKATVSTAYGKTLREHGLTVDALPVEFQFEELEKKNAEDIQAARAELDDEDLVSAVNARRKAKARAKATSDVLSANGIAAPSKEDPQVIYANLLRNFRNGGMPENQAKEIALNSLRAMFGADWTPGE